jgi:hypothetical protein
MFLTAGDMPVRALFNVAGGAGVVSGTYTLPLVRSLVVLCWGAQTSPGTDPSSVTISGHAATKVVSNGAGSFGNSSSIWAAMVDPTDANTWSVTCAGISSSRCDAQIYVLTASRLNATATGTSTAANPTATLNVAKNSTYIACVNAQGAAPPGASWTLLTGDDTLQTNQHTYSCAHKDYLAAANSQTATCTMSGSAVSAGVFAVFSP